MGQSVKSTPMKPVVSGRFTINSLDASIFENKMLCFAPFDYLTCPAIQRVLKALEFYSRFNVKTDNDHRENFIKFTQMIYTDKHFIDDSNHLMINHGEQLPELS